MLGLSALLTVAAALPIEAQAPRAAAPYTVLTAAGRRDLGAATVGDQEMLRLDEIAALLQLVVREDRAGNALTVSKGTNTVVLSLDQGLASIGGRIVSLPAAPVRDGGRWLVPPDAVSRAFALVAGVRIDLRKASRLIVLGDLRVPRVTVRQEPAGPGTRVTIDISPRAAYTVSHEPRRLLVRIEADGLDVGAISAGVGLVQAITASEPATVAISLDKGFGSFRASTVPIDAASLRLVIDLMAPGSPTPPLAGLPRAQPQQPAPPPITEAPPADAAASLLPAAMPGIRTLVLDPGHGGDELGTRGSNGTLEKDLTLDVARRLKNLLESRLGIRVILTRDDDRLVPLDERASIANNNKADLFISLHANSSPNTDAKGAEVFYLSLDGLNDEARKMAETSQSKPLATFGGGSRDIDLILWDMAQARHLAESSVFAGIIEEELRRRVEMSARAIQQAPFRVLVAANMPAVLVEMAFLSNPQQEAQLATDGFKNGVVQSLYDAILRYRARVEAQAAGRR